ncbi:anaerobic ribonucleoside-triphosphate reductase activating protein [Duganella sp. FT80W]|uniref:Anaerobic ribonucleoside-triphosphate reductase activating protein n=1 Tax=Duganella guangzhouensis TaxID=2666084 RepID=A0A6I2L9W4_9BURK|nr:anaerobic ribonucleoside-triphosphate reductase activating protein [Duganella guangzhouensis]MRW93506.1 anaerobic ribonucleoside-triphosphate reductase activating protein [Duganella guangzhouensis]
MHSQKADSVRRALRVGGYTPFSATEYPGLLSAVVFVQGCPWRCGYCHNPHLQERTRDSPIAWSEVLATLRRRAGLLDAVVFCGGEATMDSALADAIAEVRALGFKVGLETACIYPQRLRQVLPLLDWVGFDVKTNFESYAGITGVAGSGDPVRESVAAILASGVAYECRTTVHPAQLPPPALRALARTLAAMGVRHYVLQDFRATGCADDALAASALPGYPSEEMLAGIAPLFDSFSVRRAGQAAR